MMELCKLNFWYQWIFDIQSIGPSLCCVSLFLCVISNQSTNKKKCHVLDLSKLMPCYIKHTQGPSDTKVPRLTMCRSIKLLSKIKHQMWLDDPFSQRNKATKNGGGCEGWRGWTKFETWGGGVGNIEGGLHKIGDVGNPVPTMNLLLSKILINLTYCQRNCSYF